IPSTSAPIRAVPAPTADRTAPDDQDRALDHSRALAYLGRSGPTAPTFRTGTAPVVRAIPGLSDASASTPSPTSARTRRREQTLAESTRALVAARLAGVAAWKPIFRKASATAGT